MNHFKFVIFPGILLFCQNGFSPLEIRANARFNVKEVDEVLNTINSFTPEQNRKYDEELIKRISAIKRLREKYRRSKMSEMNSDLLQRRRADYYRKMIKNDLWINDPYSKASYNSKRYGPYSYSRGKKDTYNPAASEFGVFKVKHKNYYMWAAHEKDYEDEGKAMGEVEVDDPLNCLSEDEKNEKLKLICQKEKYDEPFRDPKIIEFLKGVYYNFLARSKNTSASQPDNDNNYANQEVCTPIIETVKTAYSSKLTDLHLYIGVLERTPHILKDPLIPKYVPSSVAEHHLKYYYDKVTITKDEGLEIFSNSYIPAYWTLKNNIRYIRISAAHAYDFMTHSKINSPNLETKYQRVINYSASMNILGYRPDVVDKIALNEFSRITGCPVIVSGIVINPNAPYVVYSPDALTYCKGDVSLVKVKSPILAGKMNISSVINKLLYVKKDENGQYYIKQTHRYYGEVQIAMALLRVKKCYFALYSYYDNSILIMEVNSAKNRTKTLMKKLHSVYFNSILPIIYEAYSRNKTNAANRN